MGELEIFESQHTITLSANIIIYGTAANDMLAKQIEEEIETMWNEVNGRVTVSNKAYRLWFVIKSYYFPNITARDIKENTNDKNNYIRIEEYCERNISFVDGAGSNTGYWLLENLYKGSTTAAHEFGHTIGLDHPENIDYRGKGKPGIMYARGTLVDPQFQYDPAIPAGETGGTMHPMYRKVRKEDIRQLNIEAMPFYDNKALIGAYSNQYHQKHIKP
jgi:hypothetical protein